MTSAEPDRSIRTRETSLLLGKLSFPFWVSYGFSVAEVQVTVMFSLRTLNPFA